MLLIRIILFPVFIIIHIIDDFLVWHNKNNKITYKILKYLNNL